MKPRRTARARNPNRWVLYGIMLGAMLGWAVDIIPVGIIVGLVVGIMLRERDIEEAAELTETMGGDGPQQGDTVH